MGSGVIQGLIDLLDQFLELPTPIGSRWSPRPAAMGCVPWLTHEGIADRLIRMQSCVVITKPEWSGPSLTRLHAEGGHFPTSAIRGFDEYAPRDERGHPTVVGPHGPWPPHESHVRPVRVAGYSAKNAPLLHAKVLVLGDVHWYEEEFGGEKEWFTPRLIWWGSANWTNKAESHLEFGTFSDDRDLLQRATEFVSDAIKLSEPLGTTQQRPTPEFLPVDYDDAAIRAYFAEVGFEPEDE